MRRPAHRALAVLAVGCLTAAGLAGCQGGATSSSPSGGTAPPARTSGGAQPASASPSGSGAPVSDWVRQENARPGTTDWRIPAGHVAGDDQLAGFADHSSVLPGTSVVLKVTAQAAWTVTAYRLGWYGGTGGRRVWASGTLPALRQAAVRVLAQHMVSAAHWKPSTTVDTTGWLPGSYVLKLVDQAGRQKYVPLTVRSSSFAGTTLFVSATSTYQAYNHYGGWSLYKGPTPADDKATRVSYDRPYDQDGARFAVGYERSLVFTAEKMGLDLSYATSQDLESGARAFAGVVGIISPGHDEYWSVPMRTTVEALRDRGTNLAFFGANASYWRIRFAAQGREIIGYKGSDDPVQGPTTTDLWRLYRPEASLTGQLYECFPAHGAMVVTTPGWFGFAGSGATAGSSYPGLVGVEVDRAYPAPISPAGLQVAAHSPVQCAQKGQTYSDLTWYAATSGAGVFDSGSMDFRSGIDTGGAVPAGMTAASVAFTTRVTDNVLSAISHPLAGRAHPPQPNLQTIKPPASTSTGTGGALKR